MPIYYKDVAPYSAEYDRLKLGLPTSSCFNRILTPPSDPDAKNPHHGNPSAQWQHYAHHLIAERYLKRRIDTYTSPAMERGLMVEDEARRWYAYETGAEPEPIGFVTDDAGKIGCTPDGLLGEDGLLEIKCPLPATQWDYLMTGKISRAYWPQLQGQLYVSGRKWVDIVAYHEELPCTYVRVERDEPYIKNLARELDWVVRYIETIIERVKEVTGSQLVFVLDQFQKERQKQTLKERLEATLNAESSQQEEVTTETAVAVVQTVTKRRGRSPKLTVVPEVEQPGPIRRSRAKQATLALPDAPPAPKRGRGRPRKNV